MIKLIKCFKFIRIINPAISRTFLLYIYIGEYYSDTRIVEL